MKFLLFAISLMVGGQALGQSNCNLSLNGSSCSGGDVLTGIAQITADSGADIYIDNAIVGNTSYSWNTTVAIGNHQLNLCENVTTDNWVEQCSQVWVPDLVWVSDWVWIDTGEVCDAYDSDGNCTDYEDTGYYEDDGSYVDEGSYQTQCTTVDEPTTTYTCGTAISVTIAPPPPPTAALTVNGQTGTVSVSVGQATSYSWNSTNGSSATSSYTVDSPDLCGSPGGAWAAQSLNGSIPTFAMPACTAGHTYSYVYTVTNSGGKTATANLVVKVAALGPPTAALEVNGQTGTVSVSVGQATSYSWSSTNGVSATSSYTVDSPDLCGSPGGAWVANSLNGNLGTFAMPACTAGRTYTYTYTVTNSGQTATANLVVKVAPLPAATAALEVNGQTGTVAIAVGQATSFSWSSTNGLSASSSYTVDSPDLCGSPGGNWIANSLNGSFATFAMPACTAGRTYSYTYTVEGQNGEPVEATLVVKVGQLAAPTASLEANGQSGTVSVSVGQATSYSWSSANGVSAISSYTVDSPDLCGSPGGTWIANSLNGSLPTFTMPACTAGHTYSYTYTVTGSGGQTATANLVVKVAPLGPPTAALEANGQTGTVTIAAGQSTVYSWNSTNGTIASSSYTVDSPDGCGSPGGTWIANSLSGNFPSFTMPACTAGHTYTYTYTVDGSNGQTAKTTLIVTVPK